LSRERFGVEFMVANAQTENIMGKDSSNFQDFFNSEKLFYMKKHLFYGLILLIKT